MEYSEARRFNRVEFIKLLRDRGIILNDLMMNYVKFLNACDRYGFKPSDFDFW